MFCPFGNILQEDPDCDAEEEEKVSTQCVGLTDFSFKGSADPHSSGDLHYAVNGNKSACDKKSIEKEFYLFSAVDMIGHKYVEQEVLKISEKEKGPFKERDMS